MNAMARFESFLEGLVERSFARIFRARLQPIEIAKRLAREMEAGRVVGVSSVLVPNYYDVALSTEDYAHFAPIRASLEQDLAAYLRRFAGEHNYSTIMDPEVHVAADAALRPRHIRVLGQLTEPPDLALSGVQPPDAVLPTERLTPTRPMPAVAPDASPPSYVVAPGDALLRLGGTTYPLVGPIVSLGRGLENTIVLEDRRVSRSHARLISSGGHWSVRDEGSTNGTFVNGRMVTQHTLKNGDRLSLGGLEMSFEQRWRNT